MMDFTPIASGSKGNAYHVTDGYSPILIECGIPIKDIKKALNWKLHSIDGVLVSHEHMDHAKAVPDIIKSGIPVYSAAETFQAMNLSGHRLKFIEARKQFKIKTWTILPFEIQHDAANPFGFLLMNTAGEKLLFATDTYYLRYRFKGLTHIAIECNYAKSIIDKNVSIGALDSGLRNRIIRAHFSLETLIDFFKANDLSNIEEIHLIHLSDGNSDAAMFVEKIQGITGKPVYVA